jgi:nickel-dependent lactate racemase
MHLNASESQKYVEALRLRISSHSISILVREKSRIVIIHNDSLKHQFELFKFWVF